MLPGKPDIILGTTKQDRITELVSYKNIRMEREDWFRIYEAIRGREID